MSTYEISKSSLLSLKAEILRKQQELGKVKAQNDIKIRNIKKNSPLDFKNKGVSQRQEKDISEEDENLLKKSRNMLEAKTKLYEKLSKGKSNLTEQEIEYNKRYLVRFDKRISNQHAPDYEDDIDKYPEEEDDDLNLKNRDYDPAKSYDEEWVEYVDCLGRTRTCLRKDLEYLKSKDKDLKSTIGAKERTLERENPKENNADQVTELNISEDNELLSNDMRTEMLRRQWEKEEEELKSKTDIHYQDILFNEARTHGVGYYGFSKDEEERAKQQEALKNLRDETKDQQKKSHELKLMREKQLAARIKAAKNRKRSRMGLPLEEDEPETIIEQTVNETDNKKIEKDEDKKKKEAEEKKEKLLNEARKNHIRPWDIGKSGLKKHYEYSQEEWVDKKRKERPNEFAPPKNYYRSFRSTDKGLDKDVRNNTDKKSLHFSTKKYEQTDDTYHQKEEFKPTPIINECDHCDDDSLDFDNKNRDNKRNKGAEIAPPLTYDYCGPNSSKKIKRKHESENIGDSIEAGLRYLREQIEKKQTTNKYRTEMFLD